jgi:plastocyanin
VQTNQAATQVEVVATQFAFTPKTVEVPAGATVRLALVNRGWEIHDLELDDVGDVHVQARPEQTTYITFKAPPPGTYVFRCTLPGHAYDGQVGKLVVVPPLSPGILP